MEKAEKQIKVNEQSTRFLHIQCATKMNSEADSVKRYSSQ